MCSQTACNTSPVRVYTKPAQCLKFLTQMMDENDILERLIAKFKVSEICPALEQWGYLTKMDIGEIRNAGSKQKMVQEACEKCKDREIGSEAIWELDILYTHLHSKQKTWSTYELEDRKEDKPRSVNLNAIPRTISRWLDQFCDTDISMRVLDKAVWLRVAVSLGVARRNGRIMTSSDVVYIVHYPSTDFIMTSAMKVKFKQNILMSLLSALGYHSIRDRQLRGHDLQSLAEIVLYRNTLGEFREHKPDADHGNPLLLHPPRKRKEIEEEPDERIVREDVQKRKKDQESLDRAFGPYVQPALEKIEFKVETEFQGFQLLPGQSKTQNLSKLESFFPALEREYRTATESKVFRCRVKFEGTNVLEGLRNLGKRGIASVPLPKHLTSVPSQARNYFVLSKKPQNNRNIRSPAPA